MFPGDNTFLQIQRYSRGLQLAEGGGKAVMLMSGEIQWLGGELY